MLYGCMLSGRTGYHIADENGRKKNMLIKLLIACLIYTMVINIAQFFMILYILHYFSETISLLSSK